MAEYGNNEQERGNYNAPELCDITSDRLKFTSTKNLIIGKREVGKTNLALSIYDLIRTDIDDMYYFSPKESEFENFTPYTTKDLSNLNQIIEDIREKRRMTIDDESPYQACIILDDVVRPEFWKTREAEFLMFNGRTFGITLIITMQYPMGIKPEFRANFDHVMVANDDFISDRKRMFDHYFGFVSDFKTFTDIMNRLERHDFLTSINRGSLSSNDRMAQVCLNSLDTVRISELLRDMTEFEFKFDLKFDQNSDQSEENEVEVIGIPADLASDLGLYLESTIEEYENIRLEKINEIQYLTSMISYANTRIRQLSEELKDL